MRTFWLILPSPILLDEPEGQDAPSGEPVFGEKRRESGGFCRASLGRLFCVSFFGRDKTNLMGPNLDS